MASLPRTRSRFYDPLLDSKLRGMKSLKDCIAKKMLIFEGVEFLLTGFSRRKEKEIEELVQKHGGTVLLDISSKLFCQLPLIVISSKKVCYIILSCVLLFLSHASNWNSGTKGKLIFVIGI